MLGKCSYIMSWVKNHFWKKMLKYNLCKHIKKLQNSEITPTRTAVRILPNNLAIIWVYHISREDWLKLFLHQNNTFYEKCRVSRWPQLKDLINKRLINIFNMDETGLQLNNDPGKVIAAKGSKYVHEIKGQEREETIRVVACCNAEGLFLPPYCIFRGME